MTWFAVYDSTTGDLKSVGTVIAPQAALDAQNLTAVQLAGKPDDATMWDKTSKAFVARPAKVLVDRLQDFLDDTNFLAVWNGLSAGQKNAVRTTMIRILGKRRFRNAADTPEIND